MTTADAKVELASGLRCNLDGAIGGTYRLSDGREFWMDGLMVRAILSRIEPVIVSWIEAHDTAMQAARPTDQQEVVERYPNKLRVSFVDNKPVKAIIEGVEFTPIAPVQDDDAECAHKNTKLIDYDPAFHDGEVVCADCGAHVRWYDAG